MQLNEQIPLRIRLNIPAMKPMLNTALAVVMSGLCITRPELQENHVIVNIDVYVKINKPFVHIDIPLSITKDRTAMIMPSNAKYTQSSPIRANVFIHTHDMALTIRLVRWPNSSCREAYTIYTQYAITQLGAYLISNFVLLFSFAL